MYTNREVAEGRLQIFTGKVLDARESIAITSTATTTHGYVPAAQATSTSTSVTTNSTSTLRLALAGLDGDERHYNLPEELQVGVRGGSIVSVAHFLEKQTNRGPYVAVMNHNTSELAANIPKPSAAMNFFGIYPIGLLCCVSLIAFATSFVSDLSTSFWGFILVATVAALYALKNKHEGKWQKIHSVAFEAMREVNIAGTK